MLHLNDARHLKNAPRSKRTGSAFYDSITQLAAWLLMLRFPRIERMLPIPPFKFREHQILIYTPRQTKDRPRMTTFFLRLPQVDFFSPNGGQLSRTDKKLFARLKGGKSCFCAYCLCSNRLLTGPHSDLWEVWIAALSLRRWRRPQFYVFIQLILHYSSKKFAVLHYNIHQMNRN